LTAATVIVKVPAALAFAPPLAVPPLSRAVTVIVPTPFASAARV
jgi:hypothetical protein